MLATTFRTLGDVGYVECRHPRVVGQHCQDCGATWQVGQWWGGTMTFEREPLIGKRLEPA